LGFCEKKLKNWEKVIDDVVSKLLFTDEEEIDGDGKETTNLMMTVMLNESALVESLTP